MKTILAALLISVNVSAGNIKLIWTHDLQNSWGNPDGVSKFRIYYGTARDLDNMEYMELGPPSPVPVSIINGIATFEKNFHSSYFYPGSYVCFQVTAFSGEYESPRSPLKCRALSLFGVPNAPEIKEIE